MITELVPDDESRTWTAILKIAKQKEIRSLLNKSLFTIVNKSDIPSHSTVFEGELVLAIISLWKKDKCKAYFVNQKRTDTERSMIVLFWNKFKTKK